MTSGRVRLFVALDLPDAVRAALSEAAREQLEERAQLRRVASANLHVTLCFIGPRDEREMGPLAGLVAACAAPVGPLSLGGSAWLPPRRARVLAVELTDDGATLAALQREVSDSLAREAAHTPERRRYRPHITVARVRGDARIPASERPGFVAPSLPAFCGAALTLYRSVPGPRGVRYEPVGRSPL